MKIDVLGVDPSLNNFGLVRADIDLSSFEVNVKSLTLAQPPKQEAGHKKVVRKNSDDMRRARHLVKALHGAAEGAQIAIVEVPVGSQSARAMASYGICIGVLASCPIPIIEVTPNEVKLISVGKKTASKREMIEWAHYLYPNADWLTRKLKGKMVLIDKNEHLADAIAAIFAGMATQEFQMMASVIDHEGN